MEIKNIATVPECQGNGYGKAMIDFIAERYRGRYGILQVGTGDSPLTIPFYEKCGFVRSHTVPNFFTDHYDHPIYEGGVFAGGYGVSAEAALNFRQGAMRRPGAEPARPAGRRQQSHGGCDLHEETVIIKEEKYVQIRI